MKGLLLLGTILTITNLYGISQIRYAKKVETAYMKFKGTTVRVDPGPGWKGYNLDNDQNGFDFNFINGLRLRDKLFFGVGLGYLNFEGINGFSIFSDTEVLFFKTKLTPMFNMKFGYNHIWNQYENGTGSVVGEFAIGLLYKLKDKYCLYLQSGFVMTQQSLLRPIRIGIKF